MPAWRRGRLQPNGSVCLDACCIAFGEQVSVSIVSSVQQDKQFLCSRVWKWSSLLSLFVTFCSLCRFCGPHITLLSCPIHICIIALTTFTYALGWFRANVMVSRLALSIKDFSNCLQSESEIRKHHPFVIFIRSLQRLQAVAFFFFFFFFFLNRTIHC